MITKTIHIKFADPKVETVNHISEIFEGAKHAEHNLLVKNGMTLHMPYEANNKVFLKIDIPDECAENFNPGRHLRGISKYMLAEYGDIYKKHLVGTRLLYYL